MVIHYRLLGQTYLPLDRGGDRRRPQGVLPGRRADRYALDRDVHNGRLLDVQMAGRLGSGIAKRVDIAAVAAIRVD